MGLEGQSRSACLPAAYAACSGFVRMFGVELS